MKNLKKIAALVIVLAMALSSVAFGATFTDVSENASYSEAVEVMAALDLIAGYEDGTFGPEKTITRAEFAAIIVRAIGMSDAASGAVASTMFADVPADHWAAGYIQIANQQGIIAGYGDGNFGPSDEVTYEQAIKMIVCALGYGVKFANVPNAYPSAYLSQANTSGITVGAAGKIGEKATRAIVAKLVYNSLDVELMGQSAWGSDVKFEVLEGKTLLSEKLKVAKYDDVVVENLYFNAEDANKVGLSIDGEEAVDYEMVEGLELQRGYSCVAYIDETDDEPIVLAVVAKSGKNKTLELTADQIKEGSLTAQTNYVEGIYFETNADADDDEKIKIENDAIVIVNKDAASTAIKDGEAVDSTIAAAWAAGSYKNLTLIDNDNDGKYEVVMVTSYTAWVVDTIQASRNRFVGPNNEKVVLDPENENVMFTIKDANGKELDFADVEIGDVLNIFTSVSNGTLYEIIVTNEVVEGTITEKDGDKFIINGVEYVGDTEDGYDLGDAGKFTVDMYGNIVDFTIDEGNRKYGLLIKFYESTNETGDDVAYALILTANGEYVSYELDDEMEYEVGDAYGLIAYSVNSSNEVDEILTAAALAEADEDFAVVATDDLETEEVIEGAEYDAASEEIKNVFVADNSIIFTNKEDDYESITDRKTALKLVDKAYFVDEEEYVFEALVEDDEIVIAMIFGATAKVDATSLPMYVTSVVDTQTAEGEDAARVKGYVDGELVSIIVPDELGVTVAKGDMIQFAGEDEAIAVNVLERTTTGSDPKEDYYAVTAKVQKIAKNKIYFVGGTTVTFAAGTDAMLVRENGKVVVNKLTVADIDTVETFDDPTTEEVEAPDDVLTIWMYDGEVLGAVIYDANNDTEI